jgi:hypothetical protein
MIFGFSPSVWDIDHGWLVGSAEKGTSKFDC